MGISENVIEGFEFYPNPVTNEINLSAKTTIDQISILNILGQKVYSEKMNATNYRIDLSALEPGMYIMTASSEEITASYKIVKN